MTKEGYEKKGFLMTHLTHCIYSYITLDIMVKGARCSSVVRAFAHDAMGRQIDPSWWTH